MEILLLSGIIGYKQGYLFFRNGKIFSLISNKFLSPSANSCNGKVRYLTIKINGCTKYVHQLLAEVFWGIKSNKYLVIDHIDGNKLNSCLENLRICWQFENVRYSLEHRGLIS